MRPPQHHRSAYLRDCVQLQRVRRRAEESPHMTKAEREECSEHLHQAMEIIDRTSKKAVSPSAKASGRSRRTAGRAAA